MKKALAYLRPFSLGRELLVLLFLATGLPLRSTALTVSPPPPQDSIAITVDDTPEIVVVARGRLPKKKGNPAIPIIEKVMALRDSNTIARFPDHSYRLYRRTLLAQAGIERKDQLLGVPLEKSAGWVDSSAFSGLLLRPLSMREEETVKARKKGKPLPDNQLGAKTIGLDESLDAGMFTDNLRELFTEINPYANDINLLLNHFPGPLHPTFATSYYRYLLVDTLYQEGRAFFRLKFEPDNLSNLGFRGEILVDTLSHGLAHIEATIPYRANLNWVQQIAFEIAYSNPIDHAPSLWLPTSQKLNVLLSPSKGFPLQTEVELTHNYSHYLIGTEALDSLSLDPRKALPPEMQERLSERRTGSYGMVTRPVALSSLGEKAVSMMDYMRKSIRYRRNIKLAQVLTHGFLGFPLKELKPESCYFQLGPAESSVAWNAVEGFRVRLGGVTTGHLHPHLFFSGYAAYGFGDKQAKYYGRLAYSFPRKQIHEGEFPRNLIAVEYHHDLFIPGYSQPPMYKDGLGTLWGTMRVKRRYYEKALRLSYEKDLSEGVALSGYLAFSHWQGAGSLQYYQLLEDATSLKKVDKVRAATVGISFSYRPGRSLHRSRRGNTSFDLARYRPAFFLSLDLRPKGLWHNKTTTCHINLGYTQRVFLSRFGYVNTHVAAGFILGHANETDLFTPAINSSLILRENLFQLLRPLEYIADKHLKIMLNWHMQGLLLNYIPLNHRLHWREILSLNVFWGDTSQKNLQGRPGDFRLGAIARPMRNHLYWEGGIGLENIFQLFSVQYFYRFTPDDQLQGSRHGIKIGARFTF